jgi:DNA/RNA-binding domain of Phe-tRNA-synthetase-like protein
MQFTTDQGLYRVFPGLKIGVLVCDIDNTAYGTDKLEEIIEDIRARFPYEKPQNHPRIRVWREAFGRLGIPASKYYSSIESLVRRVLKGGPFPRINPVVDIYNAMSLKYLVPMGGHAIAPLEGDIFLGFAEGTERFRPMDSSGWETVPKGEVVYKDGKEVLTRRWVWRQCDKDKVTAAATSVFVPIDVMEGLPGGLIDDVMQDMEQSLAKSGNGRVVHRDILSGDKLATSF